MATMKALQQMLGQSGDGKTIDQYSNVGDFAQNKGYGTLKAISNILAGIENMSQQDNAQKQDALMRNAMIQLGQKNGSLPGIVPDKIDTSASPIPFQQVQSLAGPPDASGQLPGQTQTIQNGLTKYQMNQPMSLEDKNVMMEPYQGMNTQNLAQLMSMNQPPKTKITGSGNPAIDKLKAAIDVLKSDPMVQYTDPERYNGILSDIDSARKGLFGENKKETPGQFMPSPKPKGK